MKRHNKRTITIFLISAIAIMLVFNIYAYYLNGVKIVQINTWFITPFILLLLSIAVMPFINKHWWEQNYPIVALILGFIVVVYYSVSLHNTPRLFLSLYEYISFISLIGSLFVVSGGIHVKVRGKSTPIGNIALLATGGVLANILGTTGASMLLIRPFIRLNKYRIKGYHIVFFIFIVSNIGGALTPIGDPPLFLGYLKGIPFFWIITKVSEIWIFTMALVLLIFFVIDKRAFDKESAKNKKAAENLDEPEVAGLHNIVYLIIILGAVFIESPAPLLLRETIMWGAAIASYLSTRKEIHDKNEFNFLPIKEVAILFAGIFATMIPALDYLEHHAASMGIVTTSQYFWGTGALSAVLDNAPTYLNFLTAAFGLHGAKIDNIQHVHLILGITTPAATGMPNPLVSGALQITSETWKYVQAISLGAVFFGAITYIGNGPNFMVKSIAEQSGVKCPSFFEYIYKYSLPVLIPVFILVWLILYVL